MKCKNCSSENIVEGVAFGNNDFLQPVGPRHREALLFVHGVQTYCDLCEDCGEIQRLYITPDKGRNWVTRSNNQEAITKRKKEEASKEEVIRIEKEVEKFSEKLMNKEYLKKYIENLDNYTKHEWYDYPVKTKGPTYRLYLDKITGDTVLIKPATMNLHKGNYVVCYSIPEPKETFY